MVYTMKTVINGEKDYGTNITCKCRTTEAIRREIRNRKESIAKAAIRFNVNPKTIIKWRKREDSKDLPMGPKKIKSTVLSEAEEEAIVAFRKLTQLPLDDVLYSLQETIPHLSRSSLHRCLKRHGCSVLPKKEPSTSSDKKKFKQYPIGYLFSPPNIWCGLLLKFDGSLSNSFEMISKGV